MRRRAAWIVLVAATILLVAIGIDRRELDGTTAFYAALSAQVADTGQLMPIEHGPAPYVLKPPFMFWGTAAVFDAFGVSPWTSTVLSRLFGVLCVLLVARLATLHGGPSAGWWAALVMLVTTNFLENATTMRLDTMLVAGLLMAFVALFEKRGAWRPWLFYLGVTVGTLGKGLPGLLPLALAPLLWDPIRPVRWSWVVAAVLLLPIPLWYVGLERTVGSAFSELSADLVAGQSRGVAAWLHSSLEHLVLRPIESSPHVAVLAAFALWHAWGAWRRAGSNPTWRRRTLLLALWIIAVVLAIFAKPSQRLRYLLPALPPLAVFIGGWIAAKRPAWRPLWLPGALVVLAAFTWVMPTSWWPPNHRSGEARATMRTAVESEVAPDDRLLLIETTRQRYGRQWAGRDWSYLHLRREVEAIDPQQASAHAGRLALIHRSSWGHVPEGLRSDEIARTEHAQLVRLPAEISPPDTASTGP